MIVVMGATGFIDDCHDALPKLHERLTAVLSKMTKKYENMRSFWSTTPARRIPGR